MVFSSLTFICVFLPVVFLVYCVIPSNRVRNILLLVASLLFYAYGEPIYVLLLILSSLINYVSTRCMEKVKSKKAILVVTVLLNLSILAVFKYAAFAVTTVNGLLHSNIAMPQIVMPIGISFFTFQALSYVIDAYYGKVEVQKNYLKVLLYISFFPQLIAGPIVKYRDISKEIDNRKLDFSEAAQGFQRFICGLGKKVLIANTMGVAADHIFSSNLSNVNFAVAWLGAIAYLIQIYYDFSGYSDMAIGMGRMFGFHFKENFLYPYGATSIKDFWRRWHVSLSGWFKEYLYFPLGGNRKGKTRACVNKLIVFFCTGLWHGASWTFVVWGLYHGLFLLLEDFVPKLKSLPKVLGHIYAMIVVTIGFVIFRAETLSQSIYFVREMFTGFHFDTAANSLFIQQLTPWFLVMLLIGMLGAAPLKWIIEKIDSRTAQKGHYNKMKTGMVAIVLPVATMMLLVWCMFRLSGSSYNPFIYFRF